MAAATTRTYLNPVRIRLARQRRGHSQFELACRLAVKPATIARYESGGAPAKLAPALSAALDFPADYFHRGTPPEFTFPTLRFRAGLRSTARERAAALACASMVVEIDQWISARFVLPPVTVPTVCESTADSAARQLRQAWGLGDRPAPNLVQLCESRGVRVYSLPPFAADVDGFSFWHQQIPYILLGRRQTPARIRFDLARELGHLVLHSDLPFVTPSPQQTATVFASEFLTPAQSLSTYMRTSPTIQEVLDLRERFRTPALELVSAAYRTGHTSQWHYRQLCIELATRKLLTETDHAGMSAPEMSRVFRKVLDRTHSSPVTVRQIAEDLALPTSDVHALTFGAELRSAQPTDTPAPTVSRPPRQALHICSQPQP
ncbi:ImmA/IrrE family metallo-endopeptidase [Nocardia niigatensis]